MITNTELINTIKDFDITPPCPMSADCSECEYVMGNNCGQTLAIHKVMSKCKEESVNALQEYNDSLAHYWEDGHGDFSVLIAEYTGFVECLIALGFMPKEDYALSIDNFREDLIKRRKPR